MFKKLFLILTLCLSFAQAKVLTPEEAFTLYTTVAKDKIELHVELGKDIYLYADEFKIYSDDGILLNEKLILPTSQKYGDEMVFKNSFIVDIPLIGRDFGIKVEYQGCSTMGLCYQPLNVSFNFDKNGNIKNLGEHDIIANNLKNGSLWLIIVTFFGFGLLLSLTPCIFPMIPILSSIIVAQGGEKIGVERDFLLPVFDVFAMYIAYTIAGGIAAKFGANVQSALQNSWVIASFSAIFALLSLSMFGLYSLELPKSLQALISKMSKNSEGHGALSVVIMGFLSALIVGPCVAAPLAGALIYIGQSGDVFVGAVALFVMSFGMGVPLLVVGASAGRLLPKPGVWMNMVKNIFGICMLATAIWLLGRVIPPYVELFLWGVLIVFSAILFGLFSPLGEKLSYKFFSTILIVVFVYGLSLLVGSISKADSMLRPFEPFTSTKRVGVQAVEFEYVKNLKELEKSVKEGVVMVDFYASWCVSCKELESVTFADERVKKVLDKMKLIKVDVTKNSNDDKQMLNKYNLFGPPALIFYKDGKEVAQLVGFKNPDEFLEFLQKAGL